MTAFSQGRRGKGNLCSFCPKGTNPIWEGSSFVTCHLPRASPPSTFILGMGILIKNPWTLLCVLYPIALCVETHACVPGEWSGRESEPGSRHRGANALCEKGGATRGTFAMLSTCRMSCRGWNATGSGVHMVSGSIVQVAGSHGCALSSQWQRCLSGRAWAMLHPSARQTQGLAALQD